MAKKVIENMGANVEASLDGSKLTLVIDLDKRLGMSGSGKNQTIATTSGNQNIVHNGVIVKLGLNCFTKQLENSNGIAH